MDCLMFIYFGNMWGTNKKKNSNRIFKFCLGNVYYWNGMNRIRICLIRNTFVSWVSWIQMRVQGAKYQPTPAKKWFIKFQPVLRIHSINADPGSAQQCFGSISFWFGSGSGSEVTFDSVNRIFPIKFYARL